MARGPVRTTGGSQETPPALEDAAQASGAPEGRPVASGPASGAAAASSGSGTHPSLAPPPGSAVEHGGPVADSSPGGAGAARPEADLSGTRRRAEIDEERRAARAEEWQRKADEWQEEDREVWRRLLADGRNGGSGLAESAGMPRRLEPRKITVERANAEAARELPRSTLERIPGCAVDRFTEAWTEAIEGSLDGEEASGLLIPVGRSCY